MDYTYATNYNILILVYIFVILFIYVNNNLNSLYSFVIPIISFILPLILNYVYIEKMEKFIQISKYYYWNRFF
jgi:branched-subunit amino acid permease